MSSYAEYVIDKFAGRGILIDTNLLLLYVVGKHDEEIISQGKFGRLDAYDLEDFYLLCRLISLFRYCVTTPYVLAAVSNWVGYLGHGRKESCFVTFSETFRNFTELPSDAKLCFEQARFPFLGLTDIGIAQVAREYLVVTDDARFAVHLGEMGLDALNINHLRQALWLSSS